LLSKDEVAQEHFAILVETLEADFIHYELSILAKPIIFQE
jgi:oxygen-independent coproporphyrinogen-3 oxidase